MSEPSAMQLPPGWALASLPDICQINPPLDRCVLNDLVPVNFVPMKAVDEEGGGVSRPESCAFAEVKKGYTPFLSGDVIMAKITPCMENGKSLDLFWIKDQSLTDTDSLPAPDIIATEIADELATAQEMLARIAAKLSKKP